MTEDDWPGSPRAGLTDQDRQVVSRVEKYLSKGLALHAWWKGAHSTGDFDVRFELGRTFNDPAESYGFFDTTTVGEQDVPIMGNFQEMFYDQERGPGGTAEMSEWLRRQMREFVLRYFMRVSDFREPDPYVAGAKASPSPRTNPFSWCPPEDVRRRGFGFEQLYYKRARTGVIGKFPDAERFAIVDLRTVGREYEWIVVKVTIFNFDFVSRPFGPGTPALVVPLREESLLVISPQFIVDEATPGTARFGFGYAFMKDPAGGLTAYGPGQFDAAIELMEFCVAADCSVRVRMVFVANRPTQVTRVSLDPMTWSARALRILWGQSAVPVAPGTTDRWTFDPVYSYVRLVNALSGGLAADRWCISRDQLDRDFLLQHFMQHYQAIIGSLATWRRVRDWCDAAALPSWISTGISA